MLGDACGASTGLDSRVDASSFGPLYVLAGRRGVVSLLVGVIVVSSVASAEGRRLTRAEWEPARGRCGEMTGAGLNRVTGKTLAAPGTVFGFGAVGTSCASARRVAIEYLVSGMRAGNPPTGFRWYRADYLAAGASGWAGTWIADRGSAHVILGGAH